MGDSLQFRQARERPRILVVDDEAAARVALAELLSEEGFDVVRAASGRQALVTVARDRPDVVVSDIRMRDVSGLELVRSLRNRQDTVDLPVILMSAIDDDLGRVRSLELGADDFLPKPIKLAELLARIRVQLRRRRRVEELLESAMYDELTGVLNRRGLFASIPEMLVRSRSEHWPCSALVLDVDSFKQINDDYGHQVGDQVLRAVAVLLRDQMRSTDLVARIGGDEFVVVLAGATEAAAEQTAERLRQTLSLPEPLPPVGLSVGCVLGRARDTVESLLERADEAMYQNKAQRKLH